MSKEIGSKLLCKNTNRICTITTINNENFTVEYEDNHETKQYSIKTLKNFPLYKSDKSELQNLQKEVEELKKQIEEKDERIKTLESQLEKQMRKYEKAGRPRQISERIRQSILMEVEKKTQYRTIATMLGCSVGTISNIVKEEEQKKLTKKE